MTALENLTFGPFRLDRRHRILWHDGTARELGQRACDILSCLVAARGGVVSKDALMAAVWPGQIVEENTMQAQISLLRKAFGESGPHCIVTVPGRGYRLVSDGVLAESADPIPGPAVQAPAARPALAVPWLAVTVLPFANLSGNPADSWLGEGLAEDIAIELSRSPRLRVISRGAGPDPSGGGYVIEGSLRRGGECLRVAVRLTETASGTILWAERYDRPAADLLAMQDEIAIAVSRAAEHRLYGPAGAPETVAPLPHCAVAAPPAPHGRSLPIAL